MYLSEKYDMLTTQQHIKDATTVLCALCFLDSIKNALQIKHDHANTVDGQEQYITNKIKHHAPTAGMSPYQAVVSISSGEQFVKTQPTQSTRSTQSRLQDAHITMRA